MRINKTALLLTFLFIVNSLMVFAAEEDMTIADMIAPIGEILNIAQAYEQYPYAVDAVIYFILFISVAQVTLGAKFKGRGGKGLIASVGIALAIAMTVWSVNTGFKLANLGPLAALLIVLVFGWLIYKFVAGEKKAGSGIWIAIIAVYLVLHMIFPEFVAALQSDPKGRMIMSIFTLLFVIAIPLFIASLFKGGKPWSGGEWGGIFGTKGGAAKESPREREREREREEGERREEEREEATEENITKEELLLLKKIYRDIKSFGTRYRNATTRFTPEQIEEWGNTARRIEGELDQLLALDQKALKFVRKLHGAYLSKFRRASRWIYERRNMIRENKTQIESLENDYKTRAIVDEMVDKVKEQLVLTLGLEQSGGADVSAGDPDTPKPEVVEAFNKCLQEIHPIYNRLIYLLRVDGIMLAKIAHTDIPAP